MKQIPLTQGKFAIVDDWWYEYLMQWKWYAQWIPETKSYRAVRRDRARGMVYMHRVVARTPDNMLCDHIHHDTLDNRESELRNVNKSQNAMNSNIRSDNTSGYKGVSKHGRKWRAYIDKDGKRILLNSHSTPEEAARAYDKAAKEYFGEFASLNFPDE